MSVEARREVEELNALLGAWLARPDGGGAMGALMDEYARAAESFCTVAEAIDERRWVAERPGPDPDTASPRAVCAHVCGAARRYSDYIRKARGLPFTEAFVMPPGLPAAPRDVRPLLREALQYTEGALDGLYGADEATIGRIRFQVRWGPTLDPDLLLEHAVMHLLRHRRQLLRW
jgi:hypothetical protein